MRLLLDSHAFLWFILGDQRLSDRARLAIAAADTDVLISPATLWEMAIKVRYPELVDGTESPLDASSRLRQRDGDFRRRG